MNAVLEQVLIAVGGAVAGGFGNWVFYIRKHKATASGAEINNDRSEIENVKLIAQEWREAAQAWKDMADEYQAKHIENTRKLEEFAAQVASFKRRLDRSNRRINFLEKKLPNETNNTPTDGH